MRRGVRLGVDVGQGPRRRSPAPTATACSRRRSRRCSAAGTTSSRCSRASPRSRRELEAIELVVGLPLALSGRDTASTADARAVADRLAEGPLPVRLVDERLTTVSAQSALHASGRNTRGSRSVIDQVAAVILLQHALDAERARGEAPGALVDPKRE